jgi:hypothetical protein
MTIWFLRVLLTVQFFLQFVDVKRKLSGHHASDNTLIQLRKKTFSEENSPMRKKARPQRICVVCTRMGRKKRYALLPAL